MALDSSYVKPESKGIGKTFLRFHLLQQGVQDGAMKKVVT